MSTDAVAVKEIIVDGVLFVIVPFDDIIEVFSVVPWLVVFLVVPVVMVKRSELSGREEEAVLSTVDDSLQLVEVPLIVPGAVGVEDEAEREDGVIEESMPTEDDERLLERDGDAERAVPGGILLMEDEVLLNRDDEAEGVVPVAVVLIEAAPIEVVLEEDERLLGRDEEPAEDATREDNERLLKSDKEGVVVVPTGEDDQVLPSSNVEDEIMKVVLVVPLERNVIDVEAVSVLLGPVIDV